MIKTQFVVENIKMVKHCLAAPCWGFSSWVYWGKDRAMHRGNLRSKRLAAEVEFSEGNTPCIHPELQCNYVDQSIFMC